MSEQDSKQEAATSRDTSRLTRWVVRLLYVQIFVGAMSLVSGIFEFQLLQDFHSGLYVSRDQMMADAEANDVRQGFVATLSAIVFVVGGIAILRWIYFANANAARLSGQQMQYSPAGSVGWYFVPIVNLWKPFQAMKEIWQASAACGRDLLAKAPSYLNAWWFLWLFNGALGNLAMRLSLETKTMDDLLFASVVNMASDVVAIPLSMVFMTVVKEIAQLQDTCRESVEPQPGPAANG
jgi:hypothetical protein